MSCMRKNVTTAHIIVVTEMALKTVKNTSHKKESFCA